jgi:hypothetical protein
MKIYYCICILLTGLLACNDAKQKNDNVNDTTTQTETITTESAPVPNTLNIKIPTSTDPELNEYFKDYTSHINAYMAAVKENDKSKIKTEYDKETKFITQSMDLPARLHQDAPSEWEKYHYFMIEMGKYKSEIDESDYVKQLRNTP